MNHDRIIEERTRFKDVSPDARCSFGDLPRYAIFRTTGGIVGVKTGDAEFQPVMPLRGSGVRLHPTVVTYRASDVEWHGHVLTVRTYEMPLLPSSPRRERVTVPAVETVERRPNRYQRTFDVVAPRRQALNTLSELLGHGVVSSEVVDTDASMDTKRVRFTQVYRTREEFHGTHQILVDWAKRECVLIGHFTPVVAA